MTKHTQLGIRVVGYVVLAMVLGVSGVGAGQNAASGKGDAVVTAPVPEQIKMAKKVFLGNAGADATAQAALLQAGQRNEAYDELYAALKGWGRYELVSKPEDAELVMEVRFTSPMTSCGAAQTYSPSFQVTVFDAKTHFALWTITEGVNGAFKKETWKRNVATGAKNVVQELKRVAG